jgi:hypothetical protein
MPCVLYASFNSSMLSHSHCLVKVTHYDAPRTQFFPTSCHFLSLSSKYSHQRFVLRHPQRVSQITHTPSLLKEIVFGLFWSCYVNVRVSSRSDQLIYSFRAALMYHHFLCFFTGKLTSAWGVLQWPGKSVSWTLFRTVETQIDASKEDGLEVNAKRINRSFENVAKLKCLGTTVTNQNLINEEIESRFDSGNACYHSVQNLLSSRLLSKNVKNEIENYNFCL